jgi:hypothetical protein
MLAGVIPQNGTDGHTVKPVIFSENAVVVHTSAPSMNKKTENANAAMRTCQVITF